MGHFGDPESPGIWGFPDTPADTAAFESTFHDALVSLNAMLCDVANAHVATCVDVVPAFNGEGGTATIPSGLRDSQAQMDAIAATIDAAGYAPLR